MGRQGCVPAVLSAALAGWRFQGPCVPRRLLLCWLPRAGMLEVTGGSMSTIYQQSTADFPAIYQVGPWAHPVLLGGFHLGHTWRAACNARVPRARLACRPCQQCAYMHHRVASAPASAAPPLSHTLKASELRACNDAAAEALVAAGLAAHAPLSVTSQYATSFWTQRRMLLKKFSLIYFRSPHYSERA